LKEHRLAVNECKDILIDNLTIEIVIDISEIVNSKFKISDNKIDESLKF